ncbi:hypothetical protein DFJ74DRAFT_665816 [Hyaloraphidium curvatum]|nr:hypothetical protein DFJ74DRAFT_665816 [Hyaloraphidium curvatum]
MASSGPRVLTPTQPGAPRPLLPLLSTAHTIQLSPLNVGLMPWEVPQGMLASNAELLAAYQAQGYHVVHQQPYHQSSEAPQRPLTPVEANALLGAALLADKQAPGSRRGSASSASGAAPIPVPVQVHGAAGHIDGDALLQMISRSMEQQQQLQQQPQNGHGQHDDGSDSSDSEGSDYGMTDDTDASYSAIEDPTYGEPARPRHQRHRARKPSVASIESNQSASSQNLNSVAAGYAVTTTDDAERPYQCQYPDCGRRFTRRADCMRHVKIHLNERPFACPDCPKRFIQRHALVVHMRKHTGERPFACDLCDRKFTEVGPADAPPGSPLTLRRPALPALPYRLQSSSLTRHRRIHTQERPFGCHICNKFFTRKSTLHRHIDRHNGVGGNYTDEDSDGEYEEASTRGHSPNPGSGSRRRAAPDMHLRMDGLEQHQHQVSPVDIPSIRVIHEPEPHPVPTRAPRSPHALSPRGHSPSSVRAPKLPERPSPFGSLPRAPATALPLVEPNHPTHADPYRLQRTATGYVIPHDPYAWQYPATPMQMFQVPSIQPPPPAHGPQGSTSPPTAGLDLDALMRMHDHGYHPISHPFHHDHGSLAPPAQAGERARSRSAPGGYEISRIAHHAGAGTWAHEGMPTGVGMGDVHAFGGRAQQGEFGSGQDLAGVEEWERELIDVDGKGGGG